MPSVTASDDALQSLGATPVDQQSAVSGSTAAAWHVARWTAARTFPLATTAWGLVMALILGLFWWFPAAGSQSLSDSYSSSAIGLKAFVRLLEESYQFEAVERSAVSLNKLLPTLSTDTILCILNPVREPTEAEWLLLADWVAEGGGLLYAFGGNEAAQAQMFDVSYTPTRPADDLEPTLRVLPDGDVTWWTDGELRSVSIDTLVTYDGTRQAIRMDYGLGRAVFLASTLPLSNRLLTYKDNPVVAVRLVEAVSEAPVLLIDESLNETGTPRVVGLLLTERLRPLTLALLLGTVVFAWWRSRRFGAALLPLGRHRQSLLEHTSAAGTLHWRVKYGPGPFPAYLSLLLKRLGLNMPLTSQSPALSAAARKSGLSPELLEQQLRYASSLAANPQAERRTVARMISKLSALWPKPRSTR